MAYESPLTIAEVIQSITANKYVLPAIQRGEVWGTNSISNTFGVMIFIVFCVNIMKRNVVTT